MKPPKRKRPSAKIGRLKNKQCTKDSRKLPEGQVGTGHNRPPTEISNPPPGPKWKAQHGVTHLALVMKPPRWGAWMPVLLCLIEHANRDTGNCWPSRERLSALLKMPVPTIRDALRQLREAGLIKSQQRALSSNQYQINWSPLFEAYKAAKALEKRLNRDGATSTAQTVERPQDGRCNVHSADGCSSTNLGIEPKKRTSEREKVALSQSLGTETMVELDADSTAEVSDCTFRGESHWLPEAERVVAVTAEASNVVPFERHAGRRRPVTA
jgi:DNA-binding transcriptional ArsR family regulator